MKKDFSINQLMPGFYTPGNSILHRTPVPWKMFLGLAMISLTALGQWTGIAIVSLVCLIGLFLANIGYRMIYQKMRTFIWFILLIGIFPVFFTPGTSIEIVSVLGLTWEGLEAGALTSCRLMLMFLVSMLFMHTTAPADIFALRNTEGNEGRSSWGFFRDLGTVGLMAFQLLPILCDEVEKRLITELNTRRDMFRGNLFHKARQAARLLIPLTVFVFENTEQFSKRLNNADRKK